MTDEETAHRPVHADAPDLDRWRRAGLRRLFHRGFGSVSFDGPRSAGREPMVQAHDRLLRGVLTGSSLVGEIESIRYLGDDVALMHATGSVLVTSRATLPGDGCTRQTVVATRTTDG